MEEDIERIKEWCNTNNIEISNDYLYGLYNLVNGKSITNMKVDVLLNPSIEHITIIVPLESKDD